MNPGPSRGGPRRARTLDPPPAAPGGREPFAGTWWGRSWIRALEGGPGADEGRLGRGRGYARGGRVGAVSVAPGRAVTYVRGSRPRPYRVSLNLRELSDEEWDALLDAVAADPAHVAALLDRGLPPVAAEAGLPPARGDLRAHCTCPDAGRLCKHAAALGYRLARHLDDDPFVLCLLRGRGEDELSAELARRSAVRAAERPHETAGTPTVAAREVLADPARPPLPEPLPVPAEPGPPRAFPPGAGVSGRAPDPTDPDALDLLAADAAVRAHLHLTGAAPTPLGEQDVWRDAVRLAATHPRLTGRGTFSPAFARLARAAGRTVTDLARGAAAWRHGGPGGLDVLETQWDPPAGDFDRGRSALTAAGLPRTAIDRNRLTSRPVQLRYGRDGRWHPYRADADGGDFWPWGRPSTDPVTALRDALAH